MDKTGESINSECALVLSGWLVPLFYPLLIMRVLDTAKKVSAFHKTQQKSADESQQLYPRFQVLFIGPDAAAKI